MDSRSAVYIDGANLYHSATKIGVDLDYKKLFGWLRQKYSAKNIFLFTGLVPSHQNTYKYLESIGYRMIFKEIVRYGGDKIKGNCDAEMVLRICNDFYENNVLKYVIVTNDGDFACIINFLLRNKKEVHVLSPNKKWCSILIRRTSAKITDLREHYHKFSIY